MDTQTAVIKKVAILDSSVLYAVGLQSYLEKSNLFKIEQIEHFSDCKSFLNVKDINTFDLVFIDSEIYDFSLLESLPFCNEILKKSILLALDEGIDLRKVSRYSGYFLKSGDKATFNSEVMSFLLKVYGKVPGTFVRLIDNENYPEDQSIVVKLNPIERKIINMISEDKNNKEIYETLCLCPTSYNYRRRRLMQKLEVNNLAGLIRKVNQLGLVS